MDSTEKKAQIKKRQNAERARKYRKRKKLEKERQRAAAVCGEASVPAQHKRKQDDLMREELNEYLINTPFASSMTEQEKIDAFYNMKLAEKRRKTNERVKRWRLNKKIEMATKRANEAPEFEQAIAAVATKRKMEIQGAQNESFSSVFIKEEPHEGVEEEKVEGEEYLEVIAGKRKMEMRGAQNESFSSVFIKEEPHEGVEEEKVEDEEYLEVDISPSAHLFVKQELTVEEEGVNKHSVEQYVIPDVNVITKEEDIEEEHHLNEGLSTTTNCVMKEEITIVEEEEESKHTFEKSYSSTLVNSYINEEMNSQDLNYEHHTASLNQREINEPYRESSSPSSALTRQGRSADTQNHDQINVYNTFVTQQSYGEKCKSTDSDIRKHKCSVCNKTFGQSCSLSQHKLLHTGVKNKKYQCDICGKAFTQSFNLSRHKLVHIKKHQCDICNEAFTKSSILLNHKLLHTHNDETFECEICKKTFTHSSHLSQHKAIHADFKKFHECDICGEFFTYLKDLLKHKKVNHTDMKMYKCSVCNRNMYTLKRVKRHYKTVHAGIRK